MTDRQMRRWRGSVGSSSPQSATAIMNVMTVPQRPRQESLPTTDLRVRSLCAAKPPKGGDSLVSSRPVQTELYRERVRALVVPEVLDRHTDQYRQIQEGNRSRW
jgi:hypothetical protein